MYLVLNVKVGEVGSKHILAKTNCMYIALKKSLFLKERILKISYLHSISEFCHVILL